MDEVAPWYSNRVSIVYFEDMTIEEVEQNLSRLARGDLVLLLTFNRDKAGRVLRYRDAGTRICASSPVPVYGVWAFYLDDGIVGGMLTSGSTHGKTAAELALRVIGGEPPSAIPVVREGQNQYMFSFPAMERFGIRSSDLPPGSLVVNRPAKFYQVSRRVVWTLAGGTAVLAALGCLFAWAVYQKLRAQGALEAANRRLQGEIAERAKAEDRLRHEQRLFTGGPTVVFKWRNAEGWPVEYASPNVRSLLGYAPEDFTSGRVNYASLIHPEDLQRIKDEIREYADSGAPHFEQEYRLAGSDGPYRWVHDFTIVIRDERAEVTHYHGYVVDVTRRKQAEEERVRLEDGIRQAQKMESLGVLAGGIAHDFNNLLTGILGFTSLALETLSPSAPARAILLDIEKSARSAADLTRQLLAYSGKGKFVMQAVDLSELVREMARLLEITVSKKCVLRYQLTENLPLVEADATQLQQVMMNLIINASEAVKDSGGVIAVRTDAQVCDADHLATFFAREDLAPGAYACLEVADNGCGMSPEVQARMFEPFFSTKFTGRGLGLSAVLGIVRGHGGAIKVYSEAGQGTTVKMIFPASAAAQKLAAGRPEASPEFKGSGRILVVDDESTVRSVATQVLERTGFTVLAAASGVEAVRMFRARPADIRLVLLDLTMPGMGGEETMRQLRKIRPDVRVVLSSGFNEQEVIQRFIGENLAGFVQKPYTVQELRDAVRKALG
jgi:PAS domain S-box-containing protein